MKNRISNDYFLINRDNLKKIKNQLTLSSYYACTMLCVFTFSSNHLLILPIH